MKENKASAMIMIRNIERCLILFNTAMVFLFLDFVKYGGRKYQFNLK